MGFDIEEAKKRIQEAKKRLPLPRLMEKLGLGDFAKKSCRCPFHEDNAPSFGISEKAGRWRWKCFAGCGEGDEINLLMCKDGLSNGDAIRQYCELAGLPASRIGQNGHQPAPARIDWAACVSAFTDEDAAKLAEWRGYSAEFCSWLRTSAIVGKVNDSIAFPVHNDAGAVSAAHYKAKNGKGWFYEPSGTATAALVVGNLNTAREIHVFESQWDAFAVCDRLNLHQSPDAALFITRGAQNGSLVTGRFANGTAVVFAWPQNDPEEKRGKNGKTPAETWLDDVTEHAGRPVQIVRTPGEHKDANDWAKAGADGEALHEAIEGAGTKTSPIRELLEPRRFDTNNPPPVPVPVLMLGESTIATPENISMIQAKAKNGKTAVIGAVMASTMEPVGDCFGFKSTNPKGLAVIHFDTEQSRYHHHMVLSRSLWRAGRKEPPPWLRSYYMKGTTIEQLKAALYEELETAKTECGGVLMVILDGIGDFIADVNDAELSQALVAEIESLAVQYQTVFLLVLHENPGSTEGKTRGHLGSHLERKAETNLRLEKDSDGVTVIYTERSRGAQIPKDRGPRFAWSDEAKMHVTTDASFRAPGQPKKDPNAPRKNAAVTAAKALFAKFFAKGANVRRSLLAAESGIKERTFDKYWGVLKDNNWIEQEKTMKSLWVATPAWTAELIAEYPEEEE